MLQKQGLHVILEIATKQIENTPAKEIKTLPGFRNTEM